MKISKVSVVYVHESKEIIGEFQPETEIFLAEGFNIFEGTIDEFALFIESSNDK